ncbi:MAG: Asp23/Gls24 family envelope stress response protein [Opitutales bacterium]|nr:Asp23/Gls24 family envelope stress response protein [Opitutales bacterium]
MESNTPKEQPVKPKTASPVAPDVELEDLAMSEETSTGVIKVSHEVVGNIVRIAALEVPGVVSVGGTGGIRDEIVGLFNKRDSAPGITVAENERGHYEITIKVILRFGVELAKVGEEIQIAVRDQVSVMTNKKVARVDVLIDGVRMPEKEDKLQGYSQ